MEAAYVRGFSFMPNNKVEVVDLEDALERTWRHTRRERLKQREQKIWEEFVKENDIVSTVCEDDQYQFLDDLPESCVQEILQSELLKIKKVKPVEEPKVEEPPALDEQTVVNSLEDDVEDVFHIYDDERDEPSPMEDGPLNESTGSPPRPPTVRARDQRAEPGPADAAEDAQFERPSSGSNTLSTTKSSENLTNVIESSIYCAKVKELRLKVNDEVLDMVSLLDRRDIFSMEKEDIARMIKRSSEFCSRFNRIYMYQLQRQMADIKRNNSVTLPFAKHTQFQSQMVRIVSLHQNLLQSFQVFRKSVEQTCCVRDCVSALGALLSTARAATELCASLSRPDSLAPAQQLYEDDLVSSCDKLEQFVNEYAVRCEEFLLGYANMVSGRSKKPKEAKKTKKRSLNLRQASKSSSEADARLSMYSMGTLPSNPKSSGSKDTHSGLNKSHSTVNDADAKSDRRSKSPRSRRKSPRSRRPLMRDPHEGRPRAPRPVRALRDDIPTMVEAVVACASSHMLNEDRSPQKPPRRSKGIHKEVISKKSPPNTPRKHKIQNSKPVQSFIQTVSQEPNFAKHSPTYKIRTNFKKKNEEEKTHEERTKIENDNKIEEEIKNGDNNLDGENDSASVESVKPDSPKNDSAKRKSTKPGVVKLEPIKSVLVRPMAVKLEATVHCDSPKVEALDPQLSNPESPKSDVLKSPNRKSSRSADRCEVTRLLQQLCSGDTSGVRIERSSGSKNAQLLYVNSTSPRPQPSTPQLLRILEETIQKKVPKSLLKKSGTRDVEKYRLNFHIADSVSENLFQYRTKFVQHMLTSPMYANSAVGKPWEMIGSISEQIIDELLLSCVQEMELDDYISELYKRETT